MSGSTPVVLLGRAPAGRPVGRPASAAPKFTAWRVSRDLSCAEVAHLLTRKGERTSTSCVHSWERFAAGSEPRAIARPSERRLEILAEIAGESVQALSTWFDLDFRAAATAETA